MNETNPAAKTSGNESPASSTSALGSRLSRRSARTRRGDLRPPIVHGRGRRPHEAHVDRAWPGAGRGQPERHDPAECTEQHKNRRPRHAEDGEYKTGEEHEP